MSTSDAVAVIAHQGKTLGGGLDELRRLVTAQGPKRLLWYEVQKSRKAPAKVREALDRGAERLVVWGGDGMARVGTGPADKSPFIRTTRAQRIPVELSAPLRYELDGGARKKTERVKVRAITASVTICVPGPR